MLRYSISDFPDGGLLEWAGHPSQDEHHKSDAQGLSPRSIRRSSSNPAPSIQPFGNLRLIFLKTEQIRKLKASAQYPLGNLKTLGVAKCCFQR